MNLKLFKQNMAFFRDLSKEIEHVFKVVSSGYADIRVAMPEQKDSDEDCNAETR